MGRWCRGPVCPHTGRVSTVAVNSSRTTSADVDRYVYGSGTTASYAGGEIAITEFLPNVPLFFSLAAGRTIPRVSTLRVGKLFWPPVDRGGVNNRSEKLAVLSLCEKLGIDIDSLKKKFVYRTRRRASLCSLHEQKCI